MIFFLTKLGPPIFFEKPSFEIQAILYRSLFKNTQKSAVVKKLGSGKIDFSICYRSQIIFLMILIDSPELFGLRKTPNSKSRFFWFFGDPDTKTARNFWKITDFCQLWKPKKSKIGSKNPNSDPIDPKITPKVRNRSQISKTSKILKIWSKLDFLEPKYDFFKFGFLTQKPASESKIQI